MFTVFINDIPLHFAERSELPQNHNHETTPVFTDMTGGKMIANIVDMMEKSDRFQAVYLTGPNPEKLKKAFARRYRLIEAAGGIVTNEAGEMLIIFRRDMYDLPKGKIDEGESPKEAARREVIEETGVKNLTINDLHAETYHTYRTKKKKKRILKKTYWFKMHAPKQPLIPQTEEDIEKAEWVRADQLTAYTGRMYRSIRKVLGL